MNPNKAKTLGLLLVSALFSVNALSYDLSGADRGCNTPPHTQKPSGKDETTLRLVAYNVGVFFKDPDDPGNYGTIANMMKETGADVVLLNELDNGTLRTGDVDQLKTFAEIMGWEYFYGPAMDFMGGTYGDGITARGNILDSYYVGLPKGTGSEPRVLVVVELEDCVVATTHLDYKTEDSQLAQIVEINRVMTERYGDSKKPVFIGGDFNALPASAAISVMKEHWTVISPDKATFPSDNPEQTIDYFMQLDNGVPATVVVSDVIVRFGSGDAAKASDHLPVYVEVKFRRQAR